VGLGRHYIHPDILSGRVSLLETRISPIESLIIASTHRKLILWTGEKHSGKTTTAARLVKTARDRGFRVAGLLAPARCDDSVLTGFDAVDLQSRQRAPLARHNESGGATGRFEFLAEGLRLGNVSLSPASTNSADLVVVDEFGPLEMNCQGWRPAVDLLLQSSKAVILLVVRRRLAEQVRHLYGNFANVRLAAAKPESIDTVISILEGCRQQVRRQDGET
jgi:nucleoside-triphosphatase THEP1